MNAGGCFALQLHAYVLGAGLEIPWALLQKRDIC